ncbi:MULTISPECIES: phenylalanine 4-monooxygenase [unclassified Aureispira]|uniref:phenylalanine 4-monooxygenase n=1 Tax=unclassified Aureispira TaxID=2649989 RepID=UPI000697B2E7|nr:MULTISPECIES: phenylalanine 4-monooxygenase [unclassified Aureispira]WMX15613.1 phenylalanine 4-monooxygenase [Aureispira sp. CCB-E]
MRQEYDKYTAEHHQVWALMYQEQMDILTSRATKTYLKGIETVQFEEDKIPRFTIVNKALKTLTGWQVYAVPGIIDNKPFFELLAQKQFPATTWMRSLAQLKYIEEPDMFHDVFGHVPLLSEPYFAGFLNGLSQIALEFIESPTAVELMARIYWYTIEFGLIKEEETIKIYGAGILSSPGESVYSLSDQPEHFAFDLDKILGTPYIKDKFQAQYFITESYQQLYNSLPQLKERIKQAVESNLVVEDGQAFNFEDLLVTINN